MVGGIEGRQPLTILRLFRLKSAGVHWRGAIFPGHRFFKGTGQPDEGRFITRVGHELDAEWQICLALS
jgi:hypothetical protein